MYYIKLGDLRNGAIFETQDGIKAVKSEYCYDNTGGSQARCILLESGEMAHFPNGNEELVREIQSMNEQQARKILRKSIAIEADHCTPTNGLIYYPDRKVDGYMSWFPGLEHNDNEKITLDGEYTPIQLEAIAWWMRNKKESPKRYPDKPKDGAKSFLRGHPIVYVEAGEIWKYQDDMIPTIGNERPCGKCGEVREDGVDVCLGRLPGVENACCGHGVDSESYIQFFNGVRIEGFKI